MLLRRCSLLLSAITVCTAWAAHSDTARSLLESGTSLYNQSRYPEAIEQLQLAEQLARNDADTETLLDIKEVEANARRTLGRLDESLRDYEEWFRLNRRLHHPRPEGRITRYLSVLYREMGDTHESEEVARRALQLARDEHDSALEAGCLLSIGALFKDRGRYSEAIVWHRRALELAEREHLTRLQAEILNSLADAEHHSNQWERAEAHLQRALELAKSLRYLGLEGQLTDRLGELEYERGRYHNAMRLFAESATLLPEIGDPITKHFDVAYHWAKAERAAGHPEQALLHYREAIAQTERLEELTVPTEFDRALPVANTRDVYEETADLLMRLNRPQEAFQLADSGRARAFIGVLNESHIDLRSQLTEVQRRKEEELKKQIAAHREQPEGLAQALSKLEAFYLDLRRSNPAYAHLHRPEIATADDVQRHLIDDRTAFIEYLLGATNSYAWLVTRQVVYTASLPSRARVAPMLKRYRAFLSQPVTGLRSKYLDGEEQQEARRIYHLLVAPLASHMAEKTRLIIVPDQELANVPFESLIDSNGKYMAATHTIVYSQSASASLMLHDIARDGPAPRDSLLAFGDPVYDTPGLAPIPYTREEVKGIARLFAPKDRQVQLGRDASERALKSEDLQRFGYLHFAVHGTIDDSDPARSGLALSHVPGSDEDGILRAEEIAQLRLNARLVVLSGCRTADGKLLSGEGLLALSRSFHYAGAHSVVATLWNVDDVSTAAFMKMFYAFLISGQAPEDALRETKIAMARNSVEIWRNPWFWAPFIIFQ